MVENPRFRVIKGASAAELQTELDAPQNNAYEPMLMSEANGMIVVILASDEYLKSKIRGDEAVRVLSRRVLYPTHLNLVQGHRIILCSFSARATYQSQSRFQTILVFQYVPVNSGCGLQRRSTKKCWGRLKLRSGNTKAFGSRLNVKGIRCLLPLRGR
jgi:hypothetical protein